jgi:hypothetical protein
MALLDRPKLLITLSKVPPARAGQQGVQGFVDALENELEAVTGIPPTVDVQASENLPAYSVVTSSGNVADSGDMFSFGRIVGMTTEPVASGFIAHLTSDGEVTNSAWSWPPNSPLFLNGTSLSIIPPPTGFSQIIGVSRSAMTMIVQLQPPILL